MEVIFAKIRLFFMNLDQNFQETMKGLGDRLMENENLALVLLLLFFAALIIGVLAVIVSLIKQALRRTNLMKNWAAKNGLAYIKEENQDFQDIRSLMEEYFFPYYENATERRLYELIKGNYQGKDIRVFRHRSIRRYTRGYDNPETDFYDYNFLYVPMTHSLRGEIIHGKLANKFFDNQMKKTFEGLKAIPGNEQFNSTRVDILEHLPITQKTLDRFLRTSEMLFFTEGGFLLCFPGIMPANFDKKLDQKMDIILREMAG